MTTRSAIEGFLGQETLAVVGVSRQGRKFGNMAFQELRKKGYRVLPVNPHAESIAGERCYDSVLSLPEGVGGVLIIVPPAETEQVVRDAVQAGIRHIWMQQGAESEAAVRYCQEQGIEPVYKECVLMYADPVGFPHSWHRRIRQLLGRMPR